MFEQGILQSVSHLSEINAYYQNQNGDLYIWRDYKLGGNQKIYSYSSLIPNIESVQKELMEQFIKSENR